MITSVTIKNFGPITSLQWDALGAINLLIGVNATGKTFLLKALYTLIRASEEFGKGNDPRSFEEVLADKLYWTFQVEKFSELISKKGDGRLKMEMAADHGTCAYSFGEKTTNTITDCHNHFQKRDDNSVFLPAKEVLSLFKVIRMSREQMKVFGFDDTYYDLVKAFEIPPQKGRNFKNFSEARHALEEIVKGRLTFDPATGQWSFQRERYIYSINIVSEGIKKIAILDNLLGNRYLTPGSVLFIDEPESALHPEALSQFLDIITMLTKEGMQVFMATHSYFTIKKMLIIAQREQMNVPVLSFADDGISIMNMAHGMPDNSIIRESVRLYKEEVELSFE